VAQPRATDQARQRQRMDFGLRCAYAHGVSAIRTHIDTYQETIERNWLLSQCIIPPKVGVVRSRSNPSICVSYFTHVFTSPA
jgi:hypothetical protein